MRGIMARWMVRLAGDAFDLDEFPRQFPDGDLFAVQEGSHTFLVGPSLDKLDDVALVNQVAAQALDEFFGVMSLVDVGLQRPDVDMTMRDNGDGTVDAFVPVSGVASARAKAFGAVAGGQDGPILPTPAQRLRDALLASPPLRTAVLLWASPTRTWTRLYAVLEAVEHALGREASVAGLCTRAERERFTRSSNSGEVSGFDARHAPLGKRVPPENPMSLDQAVSFVGRVLEAALDSTMP